MPDFETKLCSREDLQARAAALPKPVVVTNGVFDILHRGHVTYLAQARALGASLVVAVNTDASVKRLGNKAGFGGMAEVLGARDRHDIFQFSQCHKVIETQEVSACNE